MPKWYLYVGQMSQPVPCALNSTQIAAKNSSMGAESMQKSALLGLDLESYLHVASITACKMLELWCRWTLGHLLFLVLLQDSKLCQLNHLMRRISKLSKIKMYDELLLPLGPDFSRKSMMNFGFLCNLVSRGMMNGYQFSSY